MKMEWVQSGNRTTPDEAEILEYEVFDKKIKWPQGVTSYKGQVARTRQYLKLTTTQMMLYMLWDLNTHFEFDLFSSQVVPQFTTHRKRLPSDELQLTNVLMYDFVGQNQIRIEPPFRRITRNHELSLQPVDSILLHAYHRLDCWRFIQKMGFPITQLKRVRVIMRPDPYVWDKDKKPLDEIPKLEQLAWRAFSYKARAFTRTYHGPGIALSVENLMEKKPAMIASFDKPTHSMTDKLRKHLKLYPQALNRLVQMTGTKKYVGKIRWRLNEDLLYDDRPTSGGERPDRPQVFAGEYTRVRSTTTGLKTINACFMRDKMRNWFWHCSQERMTPLDWYYKIAQKYELYHLEATPESRARLETKCREFFISQASVGIAERAMFMYYHLIMRNRSIRIGMKQWFGGGQRLYNDLRGFDDEMTYDDGDFKSLDKTIKAILLDLYLKGGTIYLDWDKMEEKNRKMYKTALKVLCNCLVVKIVRIGNNVWVVMTGVMPSGIFSTSDGDSYIVLLLICFYIEWEREKNAKNLEWIDEELGKGKFVAAIYGDDHVLGISKVLRKIFSEQGFADYVKEYWSMEIRGVRMNLPALTVIKGDYVVKPGLIFLQRYLIAKPAHMPEKAAKVVPWKEAARHFVRIPWDKEGIFHFSRVLCSIIGHAWDTLGTNYTAYQELCFLWNEVICALGLTQVTIEELLRREMKNEKVRTEWVKKIGMSMKDMLRFPTLNELIERHEYSELSDYEQNPNLAFETEDALALEALTHD